MKILIVTIVISFFEMVSASHNRAYCSDTTYWKDKHGFNCWFYERKGICKNGRFTHLARYYGGFNYNFPELNCCECGKSSSSYYKAPTKVQNSCTHTAKNSKSRHIVEYCREAQSQYSCNNQKPTYRILHCKWNAMVTEVVLSGNKYNKFTGLYLYINEKQLVLYSNPQC